MAPLWVSFCTLGPFKVDGDFDVTHQCNPKQYFDVLLLIRTPFMVPKNSIIAFLGSAKLNFEPLLVSKLYKIEVLGT